MDAHRLGWVVRGFADRSQFFLSSNDLLWLCGASAPAEIFRLCRTVHGSEKIFTVHKAARPMTRTGGEERSARGRMRARSAPGPVSGLSVWAADLAISWHASFSGTARSAGEAVKTSNVGKWHSSNFKKVARGRPADGTPWPFCFQVDMRGQGFRRGGAYVVGMKGQKWAKGWLLTSGLVCKVHRPIVRSVGNMAIRPGGSKNGSTCNGE